MGHQMLLKALKKNRLKKTKQNMNISKDGKSETSPYKSIDDEKNKKEHKFHANLEKIEKMREYVNLNTNGKKIAPVLQMRHKPGRKKGK